MEFRCIAAPLHDCLAGGAGGDTTGSGGCDTLVIGLFAPMPESESGAAAEGDGKHADDTQRVLRAALGSGLDAWLEQRRFQALP